MRSLGRTGLVVSELSLGTWGLSGDAYGAVEPADAERVIARAVEIGVTLFETADAYGGGAMERLLARAAGERALFVTKVGTDRTTAPPRRRFDAAYLRRAVERSRARLGRDALDVCLLHNPAPETLRSGEATDAMKALVAEGKVRHWGVAAGDVDVAQAALAQGAPVLGLAYNLLHASDLHRLSGDIMVDRPGILARSTLAYGLLAGEWARGREFPAGDHRAERWTRMELDQRIDQLAAVRYLVRGDVRTLRAAAVRFVLANDLVSSAVLGPRSVRQLEELVRETGMGPRYLPEEDLRVLHQALDAVGVPS